MALKKNAVSEVKHLVVSGAPEELNKVVNEYLQDGWKVSVAHFIHYDPHNKVMQTFYLLVRDTKVEE